MEYLNEITKIESLKTLELMSNNFKQLPTKIFDLNKLSKLLRLFRRLRFIF